MYFFTLSEMKVTMPLFPSSLFRLHAIEVWSFVFRLFFSRDFFVHVYGRKVLNVSTLLCLGPIPISVQSSPYKERQGAYMSCLIPFGIKSKIWKTIISPEKEFLLRQKRWMLRVLVKIYHGVSFSQRMDRVSNSHKGSFPQRMDQVSSSKTQLLGRKHQLIRYVNFMFLVYMMQIYAWICINGLTWEY